jgi:8-oxo-dGTP pyrophosphatase MutT (NUDIX family)
VNGLPGDWRELLRQAVAPLHGGARTLPVRGWRPPGREDARPRRTAAVLVGIIDQPSPEIVLTRRSQRLALHAGQVSLPGGAAMDSDPTGVLTALREAEEEIGLRERNVQPIGFLSRVDTTSDFRVLPVVGLVRQAEPFVPDRNEVDEVFTLPLALALDLDRWEARHIERDGDRHRVYSMEWQGHTIWGITAAILLDLAHRVRVRGEKTVAPARRDAGR